MSKDLVLTRSALEAPKTLGELFELAPFRANFISNYTKTTGKPDGEIIFEREKVLFMKALTDNPKLQECTRFSIYSSVIELGASGLTLADGLTYILPRGDKAQFQIGYKGRLEQINSIPGIDLAPEPQVVWSDDVFDYELGNDPKIIKHIPAKHHAPDAILEFVYLILTTDKGKKRLTILDRNQVHSRRARSDSYKYWVNNGGEHDDQKITKDAKGKGQRGEYTIKPPMWATDVIKAWKKSVVHEVYTYLPKTPRMKALDQRIQYNLDPESGELTEANANIDLGLRDKEETVDTTHEEQNDQYQEPDRKEVKQSAPPKSDKPDLGNLNDAF